MKKVFLLIIIICMSGIAYAQYVANTIEQRIDNDKNAINLDLSDIQVRQADINSIANDQTANQVTVQVPDIQAIQQDNAIMSPPQQAQLKS